jgi:formylglycine-generating enzyme required for sulfatase activity
MGIHGNRTRQDLGVIAVAAFTVVVLIIVLILHFRVWLNPPGTHDLTPQQRTAAMRSALRHGGVPALREQGGMGVLTREDIARIGNSRCIGEHECVSWVRTGRRGIWPQRCESVRANLYCAYEIVDRSGNTAAGLVQTSRSDWHQPPDLTRDPPEWFYEMMWTVRLEPDVAKAKLCEMGYCEPGALAKWKPPPRVEPPDPDAGARRRCNGVLAHIVGKGRTCLDPRDPAAREFRDCKDGFCGPVMVALPRGRYVRGTPDADAERLAGESPAVKDALRSERPAREVTIDDDIALGKFEVTFEEWDACVGQFRCPPLNWSDYEVGERGKRPIRAVSWNDIARHYLPWLNAKLGLSGAPAYRLPTDAEWEYAARAGTTTRYAFGDAIATSDAHYYDGPTDVPPRGRTIAVGSFRPNAFGLHDMHGNVWEWVEDCFGFMERVADLPTDGSARKEARCQERAVRGGSYQSQPLWVRSASRGYDRADNQRKDVGLRLARTLRAR